MPRFFITGIIPPGQNRIILEADDSHHIKNVLRLAVNEQVEVCDRSGTDFLASIAAFEGGLVVLEIIQRQQNVTEPPYRAVLYQGLVKGDKMDTIIQKAVELGVDEVVPVICGRSVVRWKDDSGGRKIERWNKIARSAAGQCGRGRIPEVSECLDFSAAVQKGAKADIRLIPWEGERSVSLRTGLDSLDYNGKPEISIFIGPEGGFTAEEIDEAVKAGIRPVTLGKRILRTETAGPAVLAMLIYRFSDF